MAGLWAQPQAPLPRMGPCQRGMRGTGPAAAHKGGTQCHSPEGLLGNLQSEKKTKGQSHKDWAKGRDQGGGKQAEAGSGAYHELDCAS